MQKTYRGMFAPACTIAYRYIIINLRMFHTRSSKDMKIIKYIISQTTTSSFLQD